MPSSARAKPGSGILAWPCIRAANCSSAGSGARRSRCNRRSRCPVNNSRGDSLYTLKSIGSAGGAICPQSPNELSTKTMAQVSKACSNDTLAVDRRRARRRFQSVYILKNKELIFLPQMAPSLLESQAN